MWFFNVIQCGRSSSRSTARILKVRRGWLGVNIGNVTDDMAGGSGLSDTSGEGLDVSDGPAWDAGLKSMDIIIF